jgi:hypothetical protein
MEFVGLEVMDRITGRSKPKIDTELTDLTWRRTDLSDLFVNLTGSSPVLEEVRVSHGIVDVDLIQIDGRNHPEFNKKFEEGARIPVDHLSLIRDTAQVRLEQRALKRHSERMLPLIGKVQLLKQQLK